MSGTTNKCGSVDKYCPAGSSAPSSVSEGYYSGPEDADVDVRSESTICPIGYYCTGGVKRACPAGSYGTSEGLSSSTCTASCEAGYYCPGGDEKLECGSVEKYCPAGSSAPSDVPEGYYSGPESAEETKRYQKVICPAGSYCSGGGWYDLPLTVFSFSPLIYPILFLSHNSLYTQNGTSCFPLDEEIIDIKRIKSHLHGLPWNLMDIHELWTSMEIHGFCVDFHGHPSLHGLPWRSIVSVWNSMEFHRLVGIHGDPSILCGTP